MRIGLGWRPELGASILSHLDEIEVVELLAEEYLQADKATRRALRFLREQVPVVVHGTSLGMASPERVDPRRLDAFARLMEWLEPDFWSEHLALVRGGGLEIGHLAAPPRNDATLEGLRRNMEDARRIVGSAPVLENIATLVEPPLSTYGEGEWLRAVDCELLVDLHNLHANATNFGFDPLDELAHVPRERIRAVHLAGGRRVERNRLLDDHLHAVPDEVFALLPYVAEEGVSVIIERDGNYPEFTELLNEVRRARDEGAGRRGQGAGEKIAAERVTPISCPLPPAPCALEPYDPAALARMYVDPSEIPSEFEQIDRQDLRLAASSFARKRLLPSHHSLLDSAPRVVR